MIEHFLLQFGERGVRLGRLFVLCGNFTGADQCRRDKQGELPSCTQCEVVRPWLQWKRPRRRPSCIAEMLSFQIPEIWPRLHECG